MTANVINKVYEQKAEVFKNKAFRGISKSRVTVTYESAKYPEKRGFVRNPVIKRVPVTIESIENLFSENTHTIQRSHKEKEIIRNPVVNIDEIKNETVLNYIFPNTGIVRSAVTLKNISDLNKQMNILLFPNTKVTRHKVCINNLPYLYKDENSEFAGISHEDIKSILYDQTHLLVKKRIHQRKGVLALFDGNMDEVENDCFKKILTYLPRFDHRKSHWSTYVYRMVSCQLSTIGVKQYKSKDKLRPTDLEQVFDRVPDNKNREIALQVREAISTLFTRHKRSYDSIQILTGIFGNPAHPNHEMPNNINISDISRKINYKYSDVYKFYNEVVKPHFEKVFDGTFV